VWMQSSEQALLADHQGKTPVSAASLTKIATTLAALETWGPTHQFETKVSTTGLVKNGVLYGDLVVTGGGDPFLVWQEAIALGNNLNRLGIHRVMGNLVIEGDFYMNFQSNPYLSGIMLRQAMDSATWPRIAAREYATMQPGTPRPQIVIAGAVQIASLASPKQILLLRHQSLPLAEIIKQMNIYSNNDMAEMLAHSLGGASVVSQWAGKAASIPPEEIQLVNGSGLGVENRISPRAVCAMLMAIQRYLQPLELNIADLFPVAGYDRFGTVHSRHIPAATVVKTGTLNEVSALAGVMPTRDRGLVWFAIINQGKEVENFRKQQDELLQTLLKQWGVVPTPPVAITPTNSTDNAYLHLGEANRTQIVSDIQARF
jgi:D-alanyl-D-alanine carboxypeptidase/D-alanyl-D-alanine-endopeptidase (penicillin-binding protein 4)